MNSKSKGEKGQRIAIGELAKWDIDVAVPLTDNLPWDFIVIYNNKLLKAQVKSSSCNATGCTGSIEFDLVSNNWHSKTIKKYSESDCDLMILCDFDSIYLLSPEEFSGRKSFTIRKTASANGQLKGVNFHDSYVISEKRIREVIDSD